MPSLRFGTVVFLAFLFVGCEHSQTSKIALISFGDLEGKSLPNNPDGPSRQGITTSGAGGAKYYLSDAVRDALKGSEYDTLVDIEVTAETGLLVWSNTLAVRGTALNSKNLEHLGGTR
jgi:hypothetical protein